MGLFGFGKKADSDNKTQAGKKGYLSRMGKGMADGVVGGVAGGAAGAAAVYASHQDIGRYSSGTKKLNKLYRQDNCGFRCQLEMMAAGVAGAYGGAVYGASRGIGKR